ncbi:hypothetical protein KIPB_006715, partial [Kipferlia bialata]
DCHLLAELVNHFDNTLCDITFPEVNGVDAKRANWEGLQRKVLNKLKVKLTPNEISDLATSTPGAIESCLFMVQRALARRKERKDRDEERQRERESEASGISCRRVLSREEREARKPIHRDTEMQELYAEQMRHREDARVAKQTELLLIASIDAKNEQIEALVAKLEAAGLSGEC